MEIIINPAPREITNKFIPFPTRSRLSQAIVDAYKWSDILLNNTAAFKTLRGKKRLLPEIKNIAVEFFVIQAVKNGELPFKHRVSFNSNYSHPFLELYTDELLIHFNQVQYKSKCARKAFCRDKHIKPIQSYINYDDAINSVRFDDQRYFQVNHGYQTETPSFISLGIPNEKGKFEDYIPLMEEFAVTEGFYPKSKIQALDEFSFEDFQRYAEGDDIDDLQQDTK